MSNVVVIAKLTTQPGKRPDVVAGMAPMMDHVQNEPGTLKYVMLEDQNDADVVWMYEEYDSQDSFSAHGTSDAMKALGASIGPFMAGRPELFFCDPVGGKGL